MPTLYPEEEVVERVDPRDLVASLLSILTPNFDLTTAGGVGATAVRPGAEELAHKLLRRARSRDVEVGERVKINVVKSKLSEYLHRVEVGEAFVITNGDAPVAILQPLQQEQRRPGALAHLVDDAQFEAARAFFSGEGREEEYAAAEGIGKSLNVQSAVAGA